MKDRRKRVLAWLLTAVIVATTLLPGSGLLYAEENASAVADTTETTSTEAEMPMESAPEENQNTTPALEEEQPGKESAEVQSSASEANSEEMVPAEPEKLPSSEAPLSGPSTGKVELQIARLTDEGLVPMPTDWYTQQVVDSVVDLDVSGNNYAIENPYLLLRLPKTDKIIDVKFVDSVAGRTERYEDAAYQYVKYTYPRLSGGMHYTYQYYFTFDGHSAKNGDQIEAQVQLFDGNDTLLKESKQVYTAKTVGFEIWSDHGWGNFEHVKKTATENGHDTIADGYVDQDSDTTTVARSGRITSVYAAVYPKKVEGLNESVGIEYPKNLKIVYTYLKEEPGFREDNPGGNGRHNVAGLSNIHKYTWEQKDNVYTFILKNPTFDVLHKGHEYATNGRYATYAASILKDNGVTVNKKLPIKIDFYKDADENGMGGEYLGTRYENFTFRAVPFKGGSQFNYWKQSFGNYNLADEFVYIYHPDYYHLNGNFYKGNFNMADKGGIPLATFIENWNRGSSYTNPYEGGKTDRITEVYTKLQTEKTYFKSVQLRALPTNSNNPNNAKHIAAIKDAIATGNTKLYGIDSAGNEHLLQEHIELAQNVSVEDSSRKYVELVVRFGKPVELDNMRLQLRERQWFVAEELQELLALGDGMHTYESLCAVTLDAKGQKEAYRGWRGYPTYFTVTPLHPTVDTYSDKPQSITYKADATFDYTVGPKLPRIAHDNNVPYGDLKEIKNVRTITLLPAGYEYTGEYEKERYDADWQRNPIAEPKITTEENYQGSGKTAVIVDYGTIKTSTYYPIKLKLRATKYAARGASDFVNYLLFDDNDFIRPLPATGNANDYVDALDLDQDGDTSEVFMQKHTTVTFIPPLELVIQNTVKYDSEYQLTTTGDLGYAIAHKINIFNNSIKDVEKLAIIDVLPKTGDHSISPNEQGAYPARESTFSTPLTGALEDCNSDAVLQKVNFYYQVTPQGKDLASVRDQAWLTKDQVSDFSKVCSIKITLKDGQVLASKEALDILIPAKIPGDTKLNELTSVAINSSAFSTDGSSYTEGNRTKVTFCTYLVKGIAYLDINKNGQYDAGDLLQKNFAVKVLNADGTPAVDFANKPIEATTDAQGAYAIPVYKRGAYKIEFVKDTTKSFQESSSGEETVANDIDPQSIDGQTAQTKDFTLSPAHREQIKNVALLPNYGSIQVVKTSADETDGEGKAKPLADVEFCLLTPDGKTVQNYKGEKIENVCTDANGEAVFELVPYGDYVVKEVRVADAYLLSTEEHPVAVSEDTLQGEDKVVGLSVTNALKKANVAIQKIDNTTRKKPLAGVEFTLFANGKALASQKTDADGNVLFEKVPYGDYVIRETQGIAGYQPSSQDIPVSVRKDGETYSYTVVNDLINPEITLSGEKIWEDAEDQDGIRPQAVTIRLLANGEETGKTTKATKESNWQYAFAKLPTYDAAGDAIAYTVSEDTVAGYETAVDGTAITNRHTPEQIEVPVEKQWVDADDAQHRRPERVHVTLYADGQEAAAYDLSAEEDWKHTFAALPKYDAGKEIAYTIAEDAIAGYQSEIRSEGAGFILTNTYAPKPVSVDPPVKKVVKGSPKEAAKFTFQMKALAKEQPMPEGSVEGLKTLTITGSGSGEFGEIVFTMPGTYRYEITEKNEGIANYKYDESTYVLTFTVEDRSGELTVRTSVEKGGKTAEDVIFINQYTEPKSAVASPKTGDDCGIISYKLTAGCAFALLALCVLWKKRYAR